MNKNMDSYCLPDTGKYLNSFFSSTKNSVLHVKKFMLIVHVLVI